MVSRPESSTSPTTVASTSHFSQISRNRVDVGGLDDRHHPLLGLGHQDLLGRQRRVAQRHPVEPHVHAAVTGGGQLGGGAGQARRRRGPGCRRTSSSAKISSVHSISSFSWNGSPTWTLGRLAGPVDSNVSRGQHRDAADAVAAGAGAVQDHLVAGAGRLGEVDLLVPHHADAERVDQRVAGVRRVEDRLAADVRQAEAVAVAADARDDPGQHPVGVGGVERPEAQRVHHRDRAGAHREDVADDAADAGRRALVGLDVRRVVVRLDLERHGVAVADVDDAGVLADADHQVLAHLVGDLLAELLEVHLGGLVGAVLAPHHRVHRQLGADVGPAAEDLADLGVLVGLEAEVGPGLLVVGVAGGRLDGVEVRTLLGQRGGLRVARGVIARG